ncbi:MAG: hypothetical protein IAE80_08660 [Anaerolinea sp.]|nr:hypothetical protein [Anaerolinea sp.]
MTINRSLSRNLSIVAVGVLLVALFSVYLPVAHAASLSFVVNDLGDASDHNVGDGFCDSDGVDGLPRVCTLRAALEEGNANANDPNGTPPPALIPHAITFSTSGTINLTKQLVATRDFTITAGAIGNILVNASTSRNLLVGSETAASTPVVTITNIIFANGNGIGNVYNGNNRTEGGCIFVVANGSLTLNQSVVRNCRSTTYGGGIYGDGGASGDISAASTINLTNLTTVRNNNAVDGGGIYSLTGYVTVNTDACVRQNTAGSGGGIYGGDDTLITIGGGSASNRGFIVRNSATNGGGIFHFLNSSLNGNHARFYRNTALDQGGAWFSAGGSTGAASAIGRVCVDCCIVNNSAPLGVSNYAVFQPNNGDTTTWSSSWWGNNWGPMIIDLDPTQSINTIGSAVSNGDGISGNGTVAVNVGLLDDGNHAGTPIPSGNWDSSSTAPSDCQTYICNPVSSMGPSRTCLQPTSCGLSDSY